MKTMVKLAVLLATLLLLNGLAFAQGFCECYEFTFTNLDNTQENGTEFTELCFSNYTPTGYFSSMCGVEGDLTLFFDRHPNQVLMSSKELVGYLKFHEWLDIFNGIVACYGYRYTVHGLITDMDNCPESW